MNFRTYYLGLSEEEREQFAKRAELKTGYISCHLVANPPRKIPPLKTIRKMADATDGTLSYYDLVDYFTPSQDAA